MADDNDVNEEKVYDWSAHYDDEGQLYYYNSKTDESSWDPPEERFNPPEEEPPVVATNDDDTNNKEEETKQQQGEYDWSAHYDEEGRLYYYNAKTDESSWDPPEEGFNPPEEEPPKNNDDDTTTKEQEENENVEVTATEEIEKVAEETNKDAMDIVTDENDTETNQVDATTTNETQEEVEKPAEKDENDNADIEISDSQPVTTEAETTTETTQQYDWSAYYDEEGRLYYYNSKTEESAWEPPEEGFNPPPPDEDVTTNEAADGGKDATEATTTDNAATAITDDDTPWIAYKDDEGREYYYNQETGETQWDKPEKYKEAPPEDEEEGAAEQANDEEGQREKSDNDVDMKDGITMSPTAEMQVDDEDDEKPVSPEPEPEIDSAEQRLRDAEDALNRPDSVLEPACMSNVSEVVAANNGNPGKAIAALIENYHGQTAVCGLLSKWLTNLHEKKKDAAKLDAKAKLLQSQETSKADQIRDMVQNVINKMAKERFTKDKGDNILNLSKSEAAFLQDMMDSTRWRKLLIDLSAAHKDSAVLLYCLRAISKRGHHREIAKRINQSDHFAVFNAMLLSELSVIGSQAVSSGTDISAATGLQELTADLRRACTATSYTYLYSVEILRKLQYMAQNEINKSIEDQDHNSDDNNNMSEERFRRSLRKWSSLIEILENSMIDPLASSSVAGSSPLFRKRRLDVALTISDLHQQATKRHRTDETNDVNNEVFDEKSNGQKSLENALLTLLRRHSVGIQLEDSVLDQLLPSGLDLDTRGVGDLLIKHPLAVRALLGHVYKPGPTRVTSPTTKNKCARLIALAVLAAEDTARKEIADSGGAGKNHESGELVVQDDDKDELALTRMILQGSQLCEQLETVISFLVTLDPKKPHTSLGQKLISLALKCAPVGLGVVMWAREFTHGSDFAASASFPTLSRSILSLVRLVALEHPFTRADTIQIALAFLKHSNSDISYQKVNAIKECSLRLLLFLLTKGEVVSVFSSLMSRLKQSAGTSELDASLVRYFVSGVLDVVKPPVSPVFMRMFGEFLAIPSVVDAVKSSYFSDTSKKKLKDLFEVFKELRQYDGSPLGKREQTLLNSLTAVYQSN